LTHSVRQQEEDHWQNIHADCSDMGLTLLEAMKLAENRHAWRPAMYSLGCQCVAYWLSSLEP